MKLAIPVMVILSLCLGHQESDPYSLSIVGRALSNNEVGISFGADQKNIPRLGDACAIAVLKIGDQAYFADPRKVKAVLVTIHSAFTLPSSIAIEEDKKPTVTVFLLNYLKITAKSREIREEVQKTLDFVTAQTAKIPVQVSE